MKVILIKKYKLQPVWQFLYFMLFYITSEFTSVDIIFNICIVKKGFRHKLLFFNGLNQTHHPLAKRDKLFLLMLRKFGKFLVLFLGCGSMTYNFTTQMTLHHLLIMPMNKLLECKDHQIYSKMLRKICMYV